MKWMIVDPAAQVPGLADGLRGFGDEVIEGPWTNTDAAARDSKVDAVVIVDPSRDFGCIHRSCIKKLAPIHVPAVFIALNEPFVFNQLAHHHPCGAPRLRDASVYATVSDETRREAARTLRTVLWSGPACYANLRSAVEHARARHNYSYNRDADRWSSPAN